MKSGHESLTVIASQLHLSGETLVQSVVKASQRKIWGDACQYSRSSMLPTWSISQVFGLSIGLILGSIHSPQASLSFKNNGLRLYSKLISVIKMQLSTFHSVAIVNHAFTCGIH